MLLTAKFIARLQLWKAAGDRTNTIELREKSGEPSVIIWDNNLLAGTFLTEKNAHCTWDELLVRDRRSRLEAELQALDKRLEVV